MRSRPRPEVERSLIHRIAGGDRRAFDALFRLYYPRLTRFVSNMARNPELIEEVVNDTLMVVWRRADSYTGASQVSTWIFAIAYRKALRGRQRLDEPLEDKDAELRASDDVGPEQRLHEGQIRARLLEAIEGLSLDHKTVVHLTYFQDFEYKEISEIMGCPVDTVKTRMFYARRHLKNALHGVLADWL